jgi:hypothetical protein
LKDLSQIFSDLTTTKALSKTLDQEILKSTTNESRISAAKTAKLAELKILEVLRQDLSSKIEEFSKNQNDIHQKTLHEYLEEYSNLKSKRLYFLTKDHAIDPAALEKDRALAEDVELRIDGIKKMRPLIKKFLEVENCIIKMNSEICELDDLGTRLAYLESLQTERVSVGLEIQQ